MSSYTPSYRYADLFYTTTWCERFKRLPVRLAHLIPEPPSPHHIITIPLFIFSVDDIEPFFSVVLVYRCSLNTSLEALSPLPQRLPWNAHVWQVCATHEEREISHFSNQRTSWCDAECGGKFWLPRGKISRWNTVRRLLPVKGINLVS